MSEAEEVQQYRGLFRGEALRRRAATRNSLATATLQPQLYHGKLSLDFNAH